MASKDASEFIPRVVRLRLQIRPRKARLSFPRLVEKMVVLRVTKQFQKVILMSPLSRILEI